MKTIFFIFCLLSGMIDCNAQQFDGIWEGRLQIPSALRIVYTFTTKPGANVLATMQSPDQSKMILPADTCFIKGDSIFTETKKYKISFKGKLIGDSIIQGVFTQGMDIQLSLKRVEKITELKRPQTPKPPFPYNSENVSFFNQDKSIQVAGTLTYPKKDSTVNYFKEPTYPAVVLITGSGPQDRDETIFGHKAFAVLADHLTKKGFAVLRVDDRGVGKTTGNFTTASTADFANDVEAAVNYLKSQPQIDTFHMGLIGHSEGGMIAPIVAARRKDIKFIVLMAGPGIPVLQLMEEQIKAVGISNGQNPELAEAGVELFSITAKELLENTDSTIIIKNAYKKAEKWAAKQDTSLLRKLELSTTAQRELYIVAQVRALNTNWYRYFLGFDPQSYLAKLNCNVLAINGSKDIQVLPVSNLAGINAALKKSKSPQFEVREIPGLNHLFQTCKTCTVGEYAILEETISPAALEIIISWLLKFGR